MKHRYHRSVFWIEICRGRDSSRAARFDARLRCWLAAFAEEAGYHVDDEHPEEDGLEHCPSSDRWLLLLLLLHLTVSLCIKINQL